MSGPVTAFLVCPPRKRHLCPYGHDPCSMKRGHVVPKSIDDSRVRGFSDSAADLAGVVYKGGIRIGQ